MTTTETVEVVDAYCDAWAAHRFEEAVALLAPSLRVEVPINDYPTKEVFAEALVRFGGDVTSVARLSELADADEAMVLYDMEVKGIGTIRMVEHFTVEGGRIVRLRQIHDTAPIRIAGGVAESAGHRARDTAGVTPGEGYTADIAIGAPAPKVFEALTTDDGLSGWWASSATGSGPAGSTVVLGFSGVEETITFRIDAEIYPTGVSWTCIDHSGLPDWNGTRVFFEMDERDGNSTALSFRHIGLVHELECYDQCHAGWDHFLASLRSYAESGRGFPFSG